MNERIRVVSIENYKDKTWRHNGSFELMKADTIVPLVAPELPIAMMSYAVALIKGEAGYQLVAVLGVDVGENLQITTTGKWAGAYVPRIYSNYPFLLVSTSGEEKVLCIDENAAVIADEKSGNEFFQSNGEPSLEVTEILNSLIALEKSKQETVVLCSVLERLDLIIPWEIKIDKDEEQIRLQGLYKIDEERLNRLSGKELETLKDAGGLVVAFSQLLSMQNVHRLATQYLRRRKEEQVIQKGQLMFSLPASDGTLSFDNL